MPHERFLRAHAFNHIPILYPAIYYSDCAGTYDWETSGDGADFVGDYTALKPLVGTNAHRLQTRATGPTIGDQVSANKHVWLPPTELGRIQCALRMYQNPATMYAMVSLLWYDGTNLHSAQIRFDGTDEGIYYRNSAGGWTPISGFAFRAYLRTWQYLDFYADFNRNEYKYVTVNNQVTDLSGIPCLIAASATNPNLQLTLVVETRANTQAGVLFDQTLLTAETP